MGTTLTIFHWLTYVCVVVQLGGALLLFRQSFRRDAETRSKRILAFILLMWGLAHMVHTPTYPFMDFEPMSIFTLVGGNFFVIICMLYPLELTRPGWVTTRNVARLTLPYIGIVTFYFLMLGLLKQPVRELNNAMDMVLHFGEFNVWYRCVLYLTVCVYSAYLFLNTSILAGEYRHRYGNKMPPANRQQIAWLNFYGIGIACITIAYLFLLLYGTLPCAFIHRALTLVVFGIIIYKAGFSSSLHVPVNITTEA